MSSSGVALAERHPQPARVAGPRRRLHSLLVEFLTPEALVQAAARVRDAGYTRWDAHCPYPVHGLEQAVGVRSTRLPWLILLCGTAGAGLAIWMQWWMNAVDYAFIVSGKPFFSLPANVPIIFELTVLLSALGAFFGMLAMNGLPALYNALFSSERFRRATSDRFFIHIRADDPRFDPQATRQLLASLGGVAVEEIHEELDSRIPARVKRGTVIVALLALVPVALVYRGRYARTSDTPIHIIQDMDAQLSYRAQEGHPLFADGRAMRPRVGATTANPAGLVVARSDAADPDSPFLTGREQGRWLTAFPPQVTVDADLLRRGQERFGIYCAVCHGLDGRGQGPVRVRSEELGTPLNVLPYTDPQVLSRPVGHIFNTITHGIRTMPAYGDQIPPADRWAIVAYVKALQQSQAASLEDVPDPERARLLSRQQEPQR